VHPSLADAGNGVVEDSAWVEDQNGYSRYPFRYEPGDASARQVLKDVHLPRFESERPPYCACIDDLKQLGIEVVEPEPHQRHVSLGGDPLAVGCFNPLVLLCTEEVAEAFANGRRSGSRPARAS